MYEMKPMKKVSVTLLVAAVMGTSVFAQTPPHDHDDTIVETVREQVSELSMGSWAAPGKQGKKTMRKQFIDRMKVAEKHADRGRFAAAASVLGGLVNHVDGKGKDWIKDDPSTEGNEQELVLESLEEAIAALREKEEQRRASIEDQNRRRGGHNQRGRDR